MSKGLYTVINLNSTLLDRQPAKLSDRITNCEGANYIGELVSAVCHRNGGDSSTDSGHYVTYTKTDDGVWYINDDSKPVKQTGNPYQSKVRGETITMLFFKNF